MITVSHSTQPITRRHFIFCCSWRHRRCLAAVTVLISCSIYLTCLCAVLLQLTHYFRQNSWINSSSSVSVWQSNRRQESLFIINHICNLQLNILITEWCQHDSALATPYGWCRLLMSMSLFKSVKLTTKQWWAVLKPVSVRRAHIKSTERYYLQLFHHSAFLNHNQTNYIIY